VSVPTAVASGVEPDPAIVPVSPLRVAIGAGLLAALYLVVVYLVRPVPDRFVRLVGGEGTEMARTGGLRMVWEPPEGFDVARLRDDGSSHGPHVRWDGNRAVIEVPRVSADNENEVVEMLAQQPLQFRVVIEAPEMVSLIKLLGLPMSDQWPVDADIDQWRPESGGDRKTDYFLRARTRAELEQAFASARAKGWTLPAGERIAFEHHAGRSDYWRSYVVAGEVSLDGNDISNAFASYDRNTNRPIVSLEMTPAGRDKFADVTSRIVGHKLATLIGDLVVCAPVIEGPIRGGRAMITMGRADPEEEQRENDVLLKVIRVGALPVGGTVISKELVPPRDGPLQRGLARGVISFGGGLVVALFAWALVRTTRPVRRRASLRSSGPWPASRLFVTLLAPAVVVALSYLPVPGVDFEALGRSREYLNLGLIGLGPLVTAFLLANLVRTVLRRQTPSLHVVAVLAIVFTGLQAWLITDYLARTFSEEVVSDTARGKILLGFGAATAALAGVAAVVRRYGLGNGYGALIAGGTLAIFVRSEVANFSPVAIALILMIAIPTAIVLRWRVYGAGESPLRVPSSGIVAAAQAGGLVVALSAFDFAGVERRWPALFDAIELVRTHAWMTFALAAVLVIAWSAAFAWPRTLGALWASWSKATLLSFALVASVLAAMVALDTRADPIILAVTTAFLLDAYGDLRARRAALERVWCVQSAQQAESLAQQLADAGIPCHLASSNLRTILGGFGAFAPVDVLVPVEHVTAARAQLS
jgi:hypothetical protein